MNTTRSGYLIAATLVVISNIVNVVLARRVSVLKETIRYMRSEGSLKKRTVIDQLDAKTSDGRAFHITFAGAAEPAILYVFSPTCKWCEANLDSIRALANGVGSRYRVLGLSMGRDHLAEYITKNNITFPVATEIPELFRLKYHLGSTPQTIVLTQNGEVLYNWLGIYEGQQKSDIEKALGVTLPMHTKNAPHTT